MFYGQNRSYGKIFSFVCSWSHRLNFKIIVCFTKEKLNSWSHFVSVFQMKEFITDFRQNLQKSINSTKSHNDNTLLILNITIQYKETKEMPASHAVLSNE